MSKLISQVACNAPLYVSPWQTLYPSHFGVFVRAAEEWSDNPDVTTALMKFMTEFVYNKVELYCFVSYLLEPVTVLYGVIIRYLRYLLFSCTCYVVY